MSASADAFPAGAFDDEHLRLLTIFHYVLAGLTGLFALLPVIHLALGIAMMSGHFADDADARIAGGIVVAFASIFIALGLTFAAALAWTGRNIARRRRRVACLVVAGLSCAMFPMGTALGVSTLVVLLRPAVKARFEAT